MADDLNRRQMLAAMLASAAPPGDVDSSDLDEGPDNYAMPVPKQGPYVPLVNRPPPAPDYSPSLSPDNYQATPFERPQSRRSAPASDMLAMALAGGAPSPAGSPSPSAPPTVGGGAPPGTHYSQLPGPPLLMAGPGPNASIPEGVGSSDSPLAGIGRMLGIGGAAPAATPPAASAAAPGGTEQDIAGAASDIAPQTPKQAEIFRARQELRAREADLTAKISGTSNIELAKVLAAQRQALAGYDQQLESAYLGTLNEKAHAPGEAEAAQIKAANGDPNKYYFTAEGAPALIPTEKEETTPPTEEQAARLRASGRNPDDYEVTNGKLSLIPTLAVTPRPVTDAERQTWGLPAEGAFTIAPGEAPKQISGGGAQEPIDAATIDYLANRVSQGDNTGVQSLGYSKVGAENRAKVLKRAAEIGTMGGVAASDAAKAQIANQVGLGGEKQGARTLGALGARINTFAEEAKQTGGEALDASNDMPRDAWVPVEKIIQMGQSATNNPKFVRLLAANNGFANTYAKAINPSGILTDEAKRQAFDILNVARNVEGYQAAVKQLTREANIVQNAIGTTRGQYGNPQGGTLGAPVAPGAPAVAPTPRVKVYNKATGKLE